MKFRSFYLLGLLGMALLLPVTCAAQVTTGATLSGLVTDPGGAGVPAAAITATNTQTGVVSRGVSDNSGAYVLPSLPPGTYNLSVEKPGFRVKTLTGITLQVAQQATVNIPLELGE